MDLSKIDISVPDLSRLQQKPLLAITVKPGDKVMVLLPNRASQNDVAGITEVLKQWAPETEFLVLSGPESITVIPGTPSPDKAPQGQDGKPERKQPLPGDMRNQWSAFHSTQEGECEYCSVYTRLRIEPFGHQMACKPCFDQLTGEE